MKKAQMEQELLAYRTAQKRRAVTSLIGGAFSIISGVIMLISLFRQERGKEETEA